MPSKRSNANARNRKAKLMSRRDEVRDHRRGIVSNELMVEDDFPRRHAVYLDKKYYHPRSLATWISQGRSRVIVPHNPSHVLNAHEQHMIRRAVQLANGHEGWIPLHELFSRTFGPTRHWKNLHFTHSLSVLSRYPETVTNGTGYSFTIPRVAKLRFGSPRLPVWKIARAFAWDTGAYEYPMTFLWYGYSPLDARQILDFSQDPSIVMEYSQRDPHFTVYRDGRVTYGNSVYK